MNKLPLLPCAASRFAFASSLALLSAGAGAGGRSACAAPERGPPVRGRGRSPSISSFDSPAGLKGGSIKPAYQKILYGGIDPRAAETKRKHVFLGYVDGLLRS